MKNKADVVVIGGGVVGNSIAFNLAKEGVKDVVVLEKEYLTSGASGRCGAGIRQQWGTEMNCRLAKASMDIFENINEELGVERDIELKQGGYLLLAYSDKEIEQFRKNIKLQNSLDIPSREISLEEVKELGAEARAVQADVTAIDEVKELVKKTREEFERAKELGYSYFQGFFFKKPEIFEGDEIPVYPNNYFEALNELNKNEPNFNKVADIIRNDMSLSYKLLKLINSAAFGLRNEVHSIKQALVILGIDEMKKWLNLMVIKKISDKEPKEIMRTALVRAKMAEDIGKKLKVNLNTSELFMVGLFSMLDTLMHQDLNDLMDDLPISKSIKAALLGEAGLYRDILQLIICYEEGRWNMVDIFVKKLNIKKEIISNSFLSAVKWGEEIIRY